VTLGIYIHVPFCLRKCPYCDFYSVPYNPVNAERYVQAVMRNIRHYSRTATVDTLYFGGGTPSLLTPFQVGNIIQSVKFSFKLADDAEITLEVNPAAVTAESLAEYRRFGINRLSVGIQSLIDSELQTLGRLHTAENAVETVKNAVKSGFGNISCDLMIGLPNQKVDDVDYSIRKLAETPITHISAYILKIEENTAFGRAGVQLPDEDSVADMYLEICSSLERHSFKQYEISNFAKIGYESRHNNKYWKYCDYLGIGPSAHSCFEGKRFAVDRDLRAFLADSSQKVNITDENPCSFEERAMLKLRLSEGFPIEECGDKKDEILQKIPRLVNEGYVTFEGGIIALTKKGFVMSNSIIGHLIF